MTNPTTETEYRDIPAEILSKAREIYEGSWPDPVAAIAEALMEADERATVAERERCAKIAEGNAAQFEFQAALADGNDIEVGANGARLSIAQEILPGYRLGLPSSNEKQEVPA